jgi:hypothetical protein
LRDAWPQGHVRATCIVMAHPLVQDAAQVVCCQGDQKVQALSPQRAQEPLTQGIGLGTPHRCLQDPQPQVSDTLIELPGKDRIPVMDQEPIGVV